MRLLHPVLLAKGVSTHEIGENPENCDKIQRGKNFWTNLDKCLELHETQSKLKSLEVNFLAACKCDPSWDLEKFQVVQGGAAGFDTGNREKLSSTQAGVAWVLLSFSLFPVSNPAAPLCTFFRNRYQLDL